jgi:hypothetical protein
VVDFEDLALLVVAEVVLRAEEVHINSQALKSQRRRIFSI